MSFRYEQIASAMEQAIAKGAYAAGSRLPSIRSARHHYGVSMATVMEAYARLEERGLIQSRPKSGHFVRQPRELQSEPHKSRPSPRAGPVSVARLAMDVLEATSRRDTMPLGTAVPSAETLPIEVLARANARAARLHRAQMAKYEDPRGARSLREAIVRLLLESDCIVRHEDVIITNGGQEALALALRAVAKPGDVITIESPTYFGILQAIEALGLRALELPTDPGKGVDLDALERATSQGGVKACILAPTYQNPLGFRMSDENKREAVGILARHNVPLIEDDVFGSLGLESPRPVTAKSFDSNDSVILCGSFSKTVSPALRIGWIVPGRYAEEVLRQKFLLNIGTATVPQLTMVEFLHGNRFRRTTQVAARTYARRLQALRHAVIEHFPPGTRCTSPAGGFVLWVEMPPRHDVMALFRLAGDQRISLSPGPLFTRANGYRNCLRLSCGAIKEDDIRGATAKLGALAHRCRSNA
jgi:DNA-binding transcriptional MocR family regulator